MTFQGYETYIFPKSRHCILYCLFCPPARTTQDKLYNYQDTIAEIFRSFSFYTIPICIVWIRKKTYKYIHVDDYLYLVLKNVVINVQSM